MAQHLDGRVEDLGESRDGVDGVGEGCVDAGELTRQVKSEGRDLMPIERKMESARRASLEMVRIDRRTCRGGKEERAQEEI